MTVTTIAQAEDWGTPYAEVRGWTVFMSQESACHATRTLNQQMQMGMHLTPVGNWELIFSTNTPHDTSRPGQFTIDGRVYNDDFYSWEAWYRLVFDEPLRAAVAAGNSMTVSAGGESGSFALDGTTAAMLKMQECWQVMMKPDPQSNKAPVVALPGQQGTGPARPVFGATPPDSGPLGQGCPAIGAHASPDVQDWGDITFVNDTADPLTVYWLDGAGQPQEMGIIQSMSEVFIQSRAGHFFVAVDPSRTCRGGLIEVPLGNTRYEIR